MTPAGPTLINSMPLRINTRGSLSKTALEIEEEAFETACYSSSSGIVISYKHGAGEVLTAESFEDSGLHFIFSKSTRFQYPSEFDPIGIGSVVQVYWTRSFERLIRGSHIVVQIEKMEVYKCSTIIRERIFVKFNSQATQGVAVGTTERNTTVVFHPNCSPKIAYDTLKAHTEGRTEFEIKYRHRENTNRMVEVYLACVPFRVEIAGNVDKVPFIVIKKLGDTPGKEGVAVIVKILKNQFMEAYFLHTSERVFFDSNSCHSNILEKIAVGSLIKVHATPTFPSSLYKWYGYDVTMCNNYLADVHTQRSFVLENNEILQNFKENPDKQPMKNARAVFQNKPLPVKEAVAKEKKPLNLFKFNSKYAQYKMRHMLLDKCYSTVNPRDAKQIVDSYFNDRSGFDDDKENIRQTQVYSDDEDYGDDMQTTRPVYSESLEDEVRYALEPFNLNKYRKKLPQLQQPSSSKTIAQINLYNGTKSKKGHDLPPPPTETEVRNRVGSIMTSDGYSLDQKVEKTFVLPDSGWKPTESRRIGIYDDLQWAMMATFCPPHPKTAGLLGGWWYRRTVPRDGPVRIVKEMETRRNILRDCTIPL